MTAEERQELGIETLPMDLGEAIEALKQNELIKNTLGEHIYQRFIEAKTIEWNNYRMQVHQWELDSYLTVY
jgi:glutamine synthetase